MNGKTVMTYLRELCRMYDDAADAMRLRRIAALLAIPAATLAQGCLEGSPPVPVYGVPDYGAPFDGEVCHDGEDNDYDGAFDCDDDECARLELCLSCFDGVDNDGNGAADCSDEPCAMAEGCAGLCDDGEDGDGDGLIDCDDPDCSASDTCS